MMMNLIKMNQKVKIMVNSKWLMDLLKKEWDVSFREKFLSRDRKTSFFSGEGFNFEAVLDEGKKEFYCNREKLYAGKCLFDSDMLGERKAISTGSLNFIINDYPYFDFQFMAYPLEHRKNTTVQDLWSLMRLEGDIKHTILMNMENAGASIPNHIHYQLIEKELPFDKDLHFEKLLMDKNDILIQSTSKPVYRMRISWDSRLEFPNGYAPRLVEMCKYPFNLIISKGQLDLIPRKTSYSPLVPDFKIGCAEVGGLFLVTDKELFSKLDYHFLKRVLSDVTFNDGEASIFENHILGLYKENKHSFMSEYLDYLSWNP